MPTIFIGLGTNLGKRADNLSEARRLLSRIAPIRAESTVIETEPWGYSDQPDFLNQVVRCETDLSPQALLHELKAIETRIGRTPTFRYGPRRIDLDLLYYDDLVLDQPGLTIPHPDLHERDFVLRPLAEIAPDWVHPVLRRTHAELLETHPRISESANRRPKDLLIR